MEAIRLTVDEVKKLLKIYYDIPRMIDEEWAAIRHCEGEKNRIVPPSVNLTGLPGGKGLPGDRTANMALSDPARYYEEEIVACRRRIGDLQEKRDRFGTMLRKLDPTDRYILELRYMGDPKNQKYHRRPTWKEIAAKTDLSDGRLRERMRVSLLQLAVMSDQEVLPGTAL